MRKTLCIIFAVTILIFAFTGCSNFSAKTKSSQISSECRDNSSSGTFSLKFSAQNKQEIQTIDLRESATLLIKFSSSVKKGEVSITIKDREDAIIYKDSGKQFSFNEAFSLESGLYKIIFDYDNAEKGTLKMEVHSDGYFEYYNEKDDEIHIEG